MIENGSIVKIHAYKHDKSIHRVWNDVTILEVTDNCLTCANNKSRVIEANGRYWNTKEPAICFFFTDLWYNVIAMLKEDGIHYYCNISTPFAFDDEAIKYIDYDLDLRIDPKFNFRILDKEEYKHHAKDMEYSDKLKSVCEDSLKKLIKQVQDRKPPFNHDYVMRYFELYKTYNPKINI